MSVEVTVAYVSSQRERMRLRVERTEYGGDQRDRERGHSQGGEQRGRKLGEGREVCIMEDKEEKQGF